MEVAVRMMPLILPEFGIGTFDQVEGRQAAEGVPHDDQGPGGGVRPDGGECVISGAGDGAEFRWHLAGASVAADVEKHAFDLREMFLQIVHLHVVHLGGEGETVDEHDGGLSIRRADHVGLDGDPTGIDRGFLIHVHQSGSAGAAVQGAMFPRQSTPPPFRETQTCSAER